MKKLEKANTRKRIILSAMGNLALEGLAPNQKAIELSNRYERGEISITQAIKLYKQDFNAR